MLMQRAAIVGCRQSLPGYRNGYRTVSSLVTA
jgi:hypothetical protein